MELPTSSLPCRGRDLHVETAEAAPCLLVPMCPFQKQCVSLESHFRSFWHIPALLVSQQPGSRRWRGGVQKRPRLAWQPAPEPSTSHNVLCPACEQLPLALCRESPSRRSCSFPGVVRRSLPPEHQCIPLGFHREQASLFL